MSTDPYHAVELEIRTSVQSAAQLHGSFIRIRSTAREDSEELMWAKRELSQALDALEMDLQDLDDSVKIVESTDARMFGIDDAEVSRRRRYVGKVRGQIESMRAEMTAPFSLVQQYRLPTSPPNRSAAASPTPAQRRGEEDHQAVWAREEQQLMIREQDRAMDSIVGTLNNLAQQAGLMGQEIIEHNEMLDDLEQNVERTDTKLNTAMRKMRTFIRKSEEKGSGWCIVILLIILMVLLIAVILF